MSSRGVKTWDEDKIENASDQESEEISPIKVPTAKPRQKSSHHDRRESQESVEMTTLHTRRRNISTTSDEESDTKEMAMEGDSRNVTFLSASSKPRGAPSPSPGPSPSTPPTPTSDVPRRNRRSRSSGNANYVNFSTLPKLTRVEPNPHGHFVTTMYKYEKRQPLSHLQIRVRLLKYPNLTQRAEWPDDLLVLEDRVFSWQEKVFSESEVGFYKSKRNIVTEVDEQYRRELAENSAAIGKYFHSYVESDLISWVPNLPNPTIRRCANKHTRKLAKIAGNKLLETKYVNSDGESIIDDEGEDDAAFQQSIITKEVLSKKLRNMTLRAKDAKGDPRPENIDLPLRNNLSVKKRLKDEAAAEIQKLNNKNSGEEGTGTEFRRQQERGIEKAKEKPEGTSKAKSKKSPKLSEKTPKSTKSDKGSTSQSHDEKAGAEETSQDEDIAESKKVNERIRRLGKTSSGRLRRARFRVNKSDYSPIRPQFQTMYIMVRIPHMTRKKRNIVVCSLKTYRRAGAILIKPAFGYRIIEAKRNHVFRLSWELLTPGGRKDEEQSEEIKSHSHIWPASSVPGEGDKIRDKGDNLLDQGDMFEMVSAKEFRLVVLGEILSAQDFDTDPLCVHYFIDTPKGWRNDDISSSLVGITHSASTDSDGVAHFSHHFYSQLAFSMDSVDEDETYPRPMLILMVVAFVSPSRIRHEGYAYVPIPSQPGHHIITVHTWKPKAKTIWDKMLDVFLDITPSLQDIRAVHIPINENEECRRPNRLGLHTLPSGSIKLRLHVLHQTQSMEFGEMDKLDLLEKMSSATILRSVQTVIAAFQRARFRAANVKAQV